MTVACSTHARSAPPIRATYEFVEPEALGDVLKLLEKNKDRASLIAGGTDLVRNIHLGLLNPDLVISLARIEELTGIRESEDGGLTIGALTTMTELAQSQAVRLRYPALAEAAGQVGSPQVRNRATMAGNLVNASPCADTAPPALVHQATLLLKSSAGSRSVAAADFMTGPGQSVRQPEEVLHSIQLPPNPNNTGSAYFTLTRRKAMEITIASATACLTLSGPEGQISSARVCLGSVAPIPLLASSAQAVLEGNKASSELLEQAAQAAAKESSPIDDLRAGAQYRRQMVAVLSQRALNKAWDRAQGGRDK